MRPAEGLAGAGTNVGTDAGGLAYRIVVAVTAPTVLLVAGRLALRVLRGWRSSRQRTGTVRATLAHLGLAALTACLCLVGAILGMLDSELFMVLFATVIGVAQGIDGYFTWNRYKVVYPQWRPSCLQTTAVHALILGGFCFPFFITWIFWRPIYLLDVDDPTVRTLGLASFAYYFVSIPARILWDVVLGCQVVTRIQELRVELSSLDRLALSEEGAAHQQQHLALIALARTTVLYMCISCILNVAIHFPMVHVIPGAAEFVLLYTLTFALACDFCFRQSPRDRGGRSSFPLPAWLRFFSSLYGDDSWVTGPAPAENDGGHGHGGDHHGSMISDEEEEEEECDEDEIPLPQARGERGSRDNTSEMTLFTASGKTGGNRPLSVIAEGSELSRSPLSLQGRTTSSWSRVAAAASYSGLVYSEFSDGGRSAVIEDRVAQQQP